MNIIESLDGTCYLTGLAHVVSLVFPCSFYALQYVSFSKFAIDAVIPGYHVCKEIWPNPVDEEEITCECEVGNSHNPLAIAIKKLTRISAGEDDHPCFFTFIYMIPIDLKVLIFLILVWLL